ncbi:MAG TPA: hypothetical protein PLS70_18250 [Acidobacteriota bacterium]|nr:hypothetical protein [Acidobacteriota bacterium]
MSNRRFLSLVVVLLTLFCTGVPYQPFSNISLAQFSSSRLGKSTPSVTQGASGPVVPPAVQGTEALNQLKKDDSYGSLAEAMAAAPYRVNWAAHSRLPHLNGAYEAVNPAQGFISYFTPEGVHLAAAGEGTPTWSLEMKLQGIGYGDQLGYVSAGTPTVTGNRVELQRNSSVSRLHSSFTEWYRNEPAGLEQGVTIDSAPGERTPGDRLRVAFDVATTLEAQLESGGQAIDFIGQHRERVVRYDKLVVTDAQEKHLPAWIRLEAGQVVLEIDDSTAIYPITIDPTFAQQAKLIAPDGEERDSFGTVAISGDTAVIGASSDGEGSVYIFTNSGTTWNFQQKLRASDGQFADSFGGAVAISGDTLVVGAGGADIGANNGQGAVYVFVRNGTIWSEQQKLVASDGAIFDGFGFSVSINGETIVVGSEADDVGDKMSQGSAYVFVRTGTTWNEQQKLTASDGASFDFFGRSVAIYNETIVIGAPQVNISTNSDQGSAYVFVRTGTTWSLQQTLTASDGAADDLFGGSVAISGETVVVGAFLDDIDSRLDQGSAYVFVRTGTTWNLQQKLTDLDGMTESYFGCSLMVEGEVVVVGAFNTDLGNGVNQGAAYVFRRTGTVWEQLFKLTPLDPEESMQFGFSVAISGGLILVGAPVDTIGENINQGSAYVFVLDFDTNYPSSLFVADTSNNRIQRFDGTSWLVVGSGIAGSGPGQFRLPEAVAADLSGNVIYVADTGNQRIQWSTDQGATWKVFASIGSGLNQVRSPQGLALDSSRNLYVSDTGNNRVLRFSGGMPGSGVVLLPFGSAANQVNSPRGLTIDTVFNLYVADSGNNRIMKVIGANQPAFVGTQIIASSGSAVNQVRQPQGVAVDGSGNLLIADTGNSRVLKFVGGNGETGVLLSQSGSALGQVRNPEGVAFSVFSTGPLAGRLMLSVGDTGNNRIVGLDLGDASNQSSTAWPALSSSGFWQLVGTPNRLGSQVGQFRAPSKIN